MLENDLLRRLKAPDQLPSSFLVRRYQAKPRGTVELIVEPWIQPENYH